MNILKVFYEYCRAKKVFSKKDDKGPIELKLFIIETTTMITLSTELPDPLDIVFNSRPYQMVLSKVLKEIEDKNND